MVDIPKTPNMKATSPTAETNRELRQLNEKVDSALQKMDLMLAELRQISRNTGRGDPFAGTKSSYGKGF